MDEKCPIHDDFDLDCEQCCAIIDKYMEENQDLTPDLEDIDSEEQ